MNPISTVMAQGFAHLSFRVSGERMSATQKKGATLAREKHIPIQEEVDDSLIFSQKKTFKERKSSLVPTRCVERKKNCIKNDEA